MNSIDINCIEVIAPYASQFHPTADTVMEIEELYDFFSLA
jgi:hypothetical protein